MKADLLIKNGLILTMDGSLAVHENSDIEIKDGKIVQIGKLKTEAAKTIDAKGKLVMPGLINTHTHAAMTLLRGAADDLPLDLWLNKVIFPLEKKYCNKEFVKVGAALAAIEMIKSGTTSFADMYYFEDEAAEVCSNIGIRAFLGEGILDSPTPNSKTPHEGLKYTEDLYGKWKNDPLISIMVSPHAPYTCSPEVFKKAKKLAEKLDVPLQTHVSESKPEVEHLGQIGYLCERLIAVHCIYLTDKDINMLKNNKVKVSHCGESNMKLASGNAPIVELLKAGITVGLGTDGAASNNNLDMFDEMDVAAKLHKLIKRDPQAMDAKTVLKMATTGGAQVLHRPDLGSLEIGMAADIIMIDLNAPHLTPLYDPYSHLVYSARGSDVETVVINGKIVMENRKLLTANEKDVIEEAREIAKKISADIPKL